MAEYSKVVQEQIIAWSLDTVTLRLHRLAELLESTDCAVHPVRCALIRAAMHMHEALMKNILSPNSVGPRFDKFLMQQIAEVEQYLFPPDSFSENKADDYGEHLSTQIGLSYKQIKRQIGAIKQSYSNRPASVKVQAVDAMDLQLTQKLSLRDIAKEMLGENDNHARDRIKKQIEKLKILLQKLKLVVEPSGK